MFAGCGCLVLIVAGIAALGALVGSNESTPDTTSSETAGVTEAPEPGSASPEIKDAVVTFYNTTFASLGPCDRAGKETAAFAERMQSGNESVYDGYAVAKAQADACRESSLDVTRVRIAQALTGEARDQAEKTQEACQNAAVLKQMAAETMMEIFDGDMKPSKMETMKEQAHAAQSGTIACAAGVMTVALKAGVDLKDLPKAD